MKYYKDKNYSRGLIIGKFMPLHAGHLNLISYGLEQCKRIILLLVVAKNDPINPEQRYLWLVEHYNNTPEITVHVIYRDNINALPQEKRTNAWCELIDKKYPNIDCIISSENYGDFLASHLNIKHLKFDNERKEVPISATKIRENYEKHINFLPEHVKKSLARNKSNHS